MTNVTKLEPKFNDARYIKECCDRCDTFIRAWRVWRAAIVKAMAARVAIVGDNYDQELEALMQEMQHASIVLDAIHFEERDDQ
jgi:hypothetical protein